MLRRGRGRRVAYSGGGAAAPPTLDAATALGDTFGGSRHTLTGTNLSGASAVTVGGTAGTIVRAASGSVRFIAPAKAAGTYDIAVTTPGGTATLSGAYEAWHPSSITGARVYQADQGVTAATSATVASYQIRSGSASWAGRDGAGLVLLGTRLLLLGGWQSPTPGAIWDSKVTTNEVWYSDDEGANWTQLLAHVSDPPTSGAGARWRRRHTAGWVVHEHNGTDYVYVIGGDNYDEYNASTNPNGFATYPSDVWRSADGETWERVASSSPWGGRMLHIVASFDGALWVMGGQTDLTDPATARNDVWKSVDGGANWTQVTAAAGWSKRGMVYDVVEHDDGLMYLVGGGTYHNTAASRTYYNDVWSTSDGITWTEVLADGHAQWAAREYHNVKSAAGRLWVLNGYNATTGNLGSVFYSADNGANWTELASAPWTASHADGVAVTPNGLVRASGNNLSTATHAIATYEGTLVSAWADQGSDAKNASQATDALKPLLVPNAYGSLSGLWWDGVRSLAISAKETHASGRLVMWVLAQGNYDVTAENPSGFQTNPPQTVIGDRSGSVYVNAGMRGGIIEYRDGAVAWTAYQRGSGLNDGQVRTCMMEHLTNGDIKHYLGSTQQGATQNDANSVYNTTWTGWDNIGGGYTGTSSVADGAVGMMFAAVVVNGTVTTAEREKLAKWAQKWGAPL